MEKKFLLYVLYITMVEIRERSLEQNDKREYWLCNMLHNVPMSMIDERHIPEAYERVIESAKASGADSWLENRMREFYSLFPVHAPQP